MKQTAAIVALFACLASIGQNRSTEIDSLTALTIDPTIPDTSLVKITNDLGYLYGRQNQFDSAYRYTTWSLELAKNNEMTWYTARNYWDLAYFYQWDGTQMIKAKEAADSAETYLLQVGSKTEIADFYMEKGSIEVEMDLLTEAASHFFSALEVYESEGDSLYMSKTYNKLSIIYSKQEQYDKAINEHRRSIRIAEALQQPFEVAMNYNNIGIIHKKLENYDSALYYYRKSLAQEQSPYHEYLLNSVSNNAAIVYELTGNLDTAKYLFTEGLSIGRKLNQPKAIAYSLEGLASIHYEQGNLIQSRNYALEALEVAEVTQNKSLYKEITLTLSKVYAALGDFRSAYNYHQDHQGYSDSVLNAENIRKIATLKNQFEFEKQLRIKSFEEQQKNQVLQAALNEEKIIRNGLIGGFILIALMSGFIYKNAQAVTKTNNELRQKNDIITEQSEKLQQLIASKNRFFSIISHDLRGPMTVFTGLPIVIKNLLEEKSYEELEQFADHTKNVSNQLNLLLDNLLKWSLTEEGQFPFNPEKLDITACIKENLSLFRAMADDKKISLLFPNTTSCYVHGDKNSLMTVIRNLVNNALKFTDENGQIIVAAEQREDTIKISIKDTGIGMTPDQIEQVHSEEMLKSQRGTSDEQGLGLGLQLVKEFTRFNSGTLEVTSMPGMGTSFILRFPAYVPAIPSEISQPADQHA